MSDDSHKSHVQSQTHSAFPSTVRQAVHDLSQPLQALRMILGIPGVVVDDTRGLPQKVEGALEELDAQLNQLQTLARVLDGDFTCAADQGNFTRVLVAAQQQAPVFWHTGTTQRKADINVYGGGRSFAIPSIQATAWVLNALVNEVWQLQPANRMVIGCRPSGRWVFVACDGAGISESAAESLQATLNAQSVDPQNFALGSGLSLARLLVAEWGGQWRVLGKSGRGAVYAFTVPDVGSAP